MDKKGNWYNMGKLSDSVKDTLPDFQDLLGHKNLQTTMICTHVTTKNIPVYGALSINNTEKNISTFIVLF